MNCGLLSTAYEEILSHLTAFVVAQGEWELRTVSQPHGRSQMNFWNLGHRCYIHMSKQQLQPKLNVAWVAGGGDPAEGWGAQEVVREVEVWVVEEVEGFGPEL